MRCGACGRLPSEECCADCHRSHDAFAYAPLSYAYPDRRVIRRSLGITASDIDAWLGERLGTVGKWERGEARPNTKQSQRWLMILDNRSGVR